MICYRPKLPKDKKRSAAVHMTEEGKKETKCGMLLPEPEVDRSHRPWSPRANAWTTCEDETTCKRCERYLNSSVYQAP